MSITGQTNTNILLESGTNEIEIMEFIINENLYGINVSKVREIMLSAPVKPMPHVHPAVEGIFKPRDQVLTVVNLPEYLTGKNVEKQSKDLFIITNFNKMYIAFRVHSVVGISRISWKDIHKPDTAISGGSDGVATGIAQCGADLVTVLDFEKIVAEIAPETSIQISEIDRMGPRDRIAKPIYIAEDSKLLSKMIQDALHKAGYVNFALFALLETYF
jgi:two-component system chemotaxis response regulator CheV